MDRSGWVQDTVGRLPSLQEAFVSRYSRAALVVFVVVLGSLALLHVVAPRWIASIAHTIHSR